MESDPFKCWSPFHNQIPQWIFITPELQEFSINRFYPLALSANTNLHKSGTLSSEMSSTVFTFMDWNAAFFFPATLKWVGLFLTRSVVNRIYSGNKCFYRQQCFLSSQQAMKVLSKPLNSWACISLKSDLRFKQKLCKNVKEATAINWQQQHI